MRKFMNLLLAFTFLCTLSCAPKHVTKIWEASGGSRSDATVEVGFVYNPQLEIADTNEQQAHEEALRRCQAWGYEEAESFGMVKRTCQQMVMVPFSGLQCQSMLVTRQFQCLGRGDNNAINNSNMNIRSTKKN